MGWFLESAEMGERVLSPSWFKLSYLSEGSSLKCTQFGSLDNARDHIGVLNSTVLSYSGEGIYTFELGEGAASIVIDVGIPPEPPKGNVIYKYMG